MSKLQRALKGLQIECVNSGRERVDARAWKFLISIFEWADSLG